MHQLRHDLKQADRNKKAVGVLFLDLDVFKAVNDSHGHSTGDLLLQQVASRLKDCVRSSDTVARFGGDEFALILTNITEPELVFEIAEKIRQSLLSPYDLAGIAVSISASIGYSLYPADSQDLQALIDLLRFHLDLYDTYCTLTNRPYETLKRFYKIYIESSLQ